MGKYYEFVMACELKKELPQEVIDTLNYMLASGETDLVDFPDHPLFETEDEYEWNGMLVTKSYYYPGETRTTFSYDDIAQKYYLTIRTHVKGNANQDIQKFLHWIAPYSQTGWDAKFLKFVDDKGEYVSGYSFVGYIRDMESQDPTLIYFREGKVYLTTITDPDLRVVDY